GDPAMIRGWIAVALLAASWLLGVSYFAPARPSAWFCTVAAAVLLLSKAPATRPSRWVRWVSIGLVLPTLAVIPWPYAAVPGLLAIGLYLQRTGASGRAFCQLGGGAVVTSKILLVQAVVLYAYASLTARTHDLPWPLTELVTWIPRLLNIPAARDGATVTIRGPADAQRIAATWELLFDPASVLFFVGALTWLACLSTADSPRPTRIGWWRRAAVHLTLAGCLWLPLRVAILIAMVFHRTMRADLITLPNVGDLLVNSGLQIGLLAGFVIVAMRMVGRLVQEKDASEPVAMASESWSLVVQSALLISGGAAIVVGLCYWVPVGQAKSGRVMVVERHSTWEPTTEPYGTEIYGEAGSYNYAAIYEYCEQFFEMSRLPESEPIDDDRLNRCDVLIVKTPTARYTPDEVSAVVRFVRNGGSLLLIGDHTNVFNMNTCLNDIARHFGFAFRNDLLFCISSPYTQRYRPPMLKHPALQHVPPMNFAVSCSIDPGRSAGRMVVSNAGLWSLPPAYQESNYHPQAEYRTGMQYGAWCQAWATYSGSGRVLAFADSTLFSNFCTYQPGKAELFVGMVQWLNHRSRLDRPWLWWSLEVPGFLAGISLAAGGLWRSRRLIGRSSLAVAALLGGGAVAALIVSAAGRTSMAWPRAQRPMPHVVIDRELSEVPLFTGAFADAKDGSGYGMFEQWIPRLGFSLSRRSGHDVFTGDALVVICPTRSVSDDYRERLVQFVAGGGHLLVLDSPDVEGSTAGSLLDPFGLTIHQDASIFDSVPLRVADCGAQPAILASRQVTGGEVIAWAGDVPVAARVRYQRGTVTVIGFGSLFGDAAMGFHWLPEPDDDTLDRYEALYALLRAALPAWSRRIAASPQPHASDAGRSDVSRSEFTRAAGDP
ncbi:MAG: hypothetical protein JJ992_06160, partial [Planctomycetes bacterium]|nr:hypothetical protein [Planctomycetota bacterium]